MGETDRYGPAMVSIVAGHSQLQTHVVEDMLEVALNDGKGIHDAETGVVGGSIRLGRVEVTALLRACEDFLRMGA